MDDEKYDLEERTYRFAHQVSEFFNRLPRTLSNYEDCKQVIRASGSVGANYIEANECLGKKDFAMRSGSPAKNQKKLATGSASLILAGTSTRKRNERSLSRKAPN